MNNDFAGIAKKALHFCTVFYNNSITEHERDKGVAYL